MDGILESKIYGEEMCDDCEARQVKHWENISFQIIFFLTFLLHALYIHCNITHLGYVIYTL